MKTVSHRDNAIASFLTEHNAKRIWQTQQTGVNLVAYSIKGKILLVQYFDEGQGWDIFIPASTSNTIESTLSATQRYLENSSA